MSWEIKHGDWVEVLKTLPDESVHCCVTSPPYWGLRDYSACNCAIRTKPGHSLTGGPVALPPNDSRGKSPPDPDCQRCNGAGKDVTVSAGQLGLERTPEEYISKIVAGFHEVRRVLRNDGTLWLNLGDSYAGGGNGGGGSFAKDGIRCAAPGTDKNKATRLGPRRTPVNLKPKDLVGIPWMVAFALRSDGWYLRQDIIWSKLNPMPESVTDRCTKAHEYLFLLSKSARYYYDNEAIKELSLDPEDDQRRIAQATLDGKSTPNAERNGIRRRESIKIPKGWASGNDHSAIGWATAQRQGSCDTRYQEDYVSDGKRNKRSVWEIATSPCPEAHFATFPPKLVEPCILAGCPEGGTVLDPFSGAGTTGLVATRLHRNYVGIELNQEYIAMSRRRIESDAPLFNTQANFEAGVQP